MADGDGALPLFASEPVAAAVLAVAFLGLLLSEFRIWRTHPDAGPARDGWTGLAVGIGLATVYLGGAAVSVLVPATVLTAGAWWWFWGGLAVAAAGLVKLQRRRIIVCDADALRALGHGAGA